MSNIDKIISKALSTSSEEEAITALRMARKKYTGGTVNTNTADAAKWEAKAREFYDAAVKYRDMYNYADKERILYRKQASDYHLRTIELKEDIRSLKKQAEKNDHGSVYFWRMSFIASLALNILTFIMVGHSI